MKEIKETKEIEKIWINKLKNKGYSEKDFVYNLRKDFTINQEKFTMIAELAVRINDENFILFKFERPTRFITPLERRTVSIARIINKKPFPFVILTNGKDCVFLNAINGKEIDREVPERDEAENILKKLRIRNLTDKEIEKEKRIFAAIDSIRCESCKYS